MYTKGEWKWEWEGGQPVVRAHDPKDPLSLIATVYPKIGKKVFAPIGEAEANAQLIVAAPRMAKFLENLCAEWEDYGKLDDSFYHTVKDILAKVKGK